MLKLLHSLFPGLHQYYKDHVSLVMEGGVIMPIRQAVCACGDIQPLGTVNMAHLVYVDPTAGEVETPTGPGKFVQFIPDRGLVLVEHDYEHLVEYPADLCFISLEGCRSCCSS